MDALARLRAAVERGTDRDLDAWAETGAPGLFLLRDFLAGDTKAEQAESEFGSWSKDSHPRDAIDNISAAVAMIAARHPGEFLEVFADSAYDTSSFVLTGLGSIDDPVATDRLARATKSSDRWIRMEAAIGLGRRVSPIAVAALVELLADLEYLVRYHALVALATVGDGTALKSLREFEPPTVVERQLAEDAMAMIESRLS